MSEKSDWEQGYDQAQRRFYEERKILTARIAELEAFIDQLIEAGNELTANPTVGNYEEREAAWTKLWLKWRTRNELQEL